VKTPRIIEKLARVTGHLLISVSIAVKYPVKYENSMNNPGIAKKSSGRFLFLKSFNIDNHHTILHGY